MSEVQNSEKLSMINTKPTSRQIESIKSYKKFYEKWDMWDYAYYDGTEYYFINQYLIKIQKGISGHLVIDRNGQVIPFNKAKDIYRLFANFNTMMSQAISDILPQMKKSMSPFQARVKLLEKYRELFSTHSSAETVASVDRIINESNTSLEIPKELNDIYYTMADYQIETRDKKGYFDHALLQKMRKTFNQYRVTMYNYGMRERSLIKDYDVVVESLKELSGKIPARDLRSIKNLLVAAKQSNQGALEKSMKEFEQDEEGNIVVIDQTRLEESLEEKFEREGSKHFQQKMILGLRNPK
ncbi:hypothetical protein DOE78_13660 [Bacillus sp. Y1]|nr:hypothetical protein [Bacillus sp. Y1]AYA76405.1 hypothetical protein DOE78_13660 [Bacillus sp. Y1]